MVPIPLDISLSEPYIRRKLIKNQVSTSRAPSAGQSSTISSGSKEAIQNLACNTTTRLRWRGIPRLACSNSWIGSKRREVLFWRERDRRVVMQVPFQDDRMVSCTFLNGTAFFFGPSCHKTLTSQTRRKLVTRSSEECELLLRIVWSYEED